MCSHSLFIFLTKGDRTFRVLETGCIYCAQKVNCYESSGRTSTCAIAAFLKGVLLIDTLKFMLLEYYCL